MPDDHESVLALWWAASQICACSSTVNAGNVAWLGVLVEARGSNVVLGLTAVQVHVQPLVCHHTRGLRLFWIATPSNLPV